MDMPLRRGRLSSWSWPHGTPGSHGRSCSVPHGLPVELAFSTQDIKEFRWRQDGEEAGVIVGLHLLDFNFQLVNFCYDLLASLIIEGFHTPEFAYFVKQHTLLVVHLVVQREERRSLTRSETRLHRDEFLQFSLELGRVEPPILVLRSGWHYRHGKENENKLNFCKHLAIHLKGKRKDRHHHT